MRLTSEIVEELGLAVGLDAVGVTTADEFPDLRQKLADYEERGLTGFEHRDIESRINPKGIFPDAKYCIAVALSYLTPAGRESARRHPRGQAYGITSVYSYGEDYHRVLHRRMRELHAKLEEYTGTEIPAFFSVDTTPLVDRRVAERAGIGWVGKNCMFFTEEHGSYVFLGTLLVDVDIETRDTVEKEPKCGSCSLCLTACPTGALVAPGVIDATRCLSYVTQMKGMIPLWFREKLGRRVWGCDTCQMVCPENKRANSSQNEEFVPAGELAYPDLIDILHLSNRDFRRQYGETAAGWRGLRIWQRNALIALGNLGDPDAVCEIVPFLSSSRSELRASAAWALQKIGTTQACTAVRDAHACEEDVDVRREMEWACEDT